MFRIIIACAFLVCAVAGHAQVYRWTDERGNLHFSDSPPEARAFEKVEIQPALSVPAFKAPQQSTEKTSEKEAATKSYQQFSIVNPEHDSAIRNNAGDLSVNIALKPTLRSGHSLVLLMDGNPVAEGRQTTFQLNNVDRGAHSLHAEIKNNAGKTLIATDPIEFSILRVSIVKQPAPF